MIKQGDWAEIVNYNQIYDNVIGYVDTDQSNGMVKFIPVRHPVKGKFKGHQWIDVAFLLKLVPRLTREEWYEMIDWALDDLDQTTFNELMKIKNFCN